MYVMRHVRTIGRWTAFVAAYVFVLNALLATALLAATHPVTPPSGVVFCTQAEGLPPALPDDGAAKRAEHLCKTCVQHVSATALAPPPVEAQRLSPVASELRISGLNWRLPPVGEFAIRHPRGPPA